MWYLPSACPPGRFFTFSLCVGYPTIVHRTKLLPTMVTYTPYTIVKLSLHFDTISVLCTKTTFVYCIVNGTGTGTGDWNWEQIGNVIPCRHFHVTHQPGQGVRTYCPQLIWSNSLFLSLSRFCSV